MVSGIKTGLGFGLALHCGGRNFIGPAGGSGRGNLFASSAYGRIWIFLGYTGIFLNAAVWRKGGRGVTIFLLYIGCSWERVGVREKYGSFIVSFGRYMCGAFTRRENEFLH